MNWDPVLLRKFSSTGHFRLLNQLRGDLKKRPLERDQQNGKLRMPGGNRTSASRPSKFADAQRKIVQDPVVVTPSPDQSETAPKTFRERLNAIQMR